MKHYLKLCISLGLVLANLKQSGFAQNRLPAWAFGGFKRADAVNPIIKPDTAARFFDPILKKEVAWESNDTFNPGAALYKGKVVVLYRSEDRSGVGIGFRTSRLGYASSSDGLHFSRETKPVFYPAEDSQKKYEWPAAAKIRV